MIPMNFDIKDKGMSEKGRLRTEWAFRNMPVLKKIGDRFEAEKPLKGLKIGACLHVTTETANLMIALKKGGASIALCASNPLSTQDDVTAHLVVDHEISVFAITGVDNKKYYEHIDSVLATKPQITMDDGADLVTMLHTSRKELLTNVIAGTEETTTGVIRLKSMAAEGVLNYPIIAVNDAQTKHLFDNRYGTGQSTVDGLIRATNMLIAGLNVVVAGYGWCGRGVARRASGMGANVIVTEVDPLKAIEAVMDGYRVMPMEEAASVGDVFLTVTGNKHILRKEHFERMKDGAIIANSGHFNVEINIKELNDLAISSREVREFVREFNLADGRKLHLLGDGRLINLAAAEGHPAQVMDMSFANQALSTELLFRDSSSLAKKVYGVPEDIDKEIARLKLASMGHRIDALTEEQTRYLASWSEGT